MVNQSVPIGTVVAFAAPLSAQVTVSLGAQGWLVCDGRSLSVVDYPELFSFLQYSYGGSGASFRIPTIPSLKSGTGELASIIKAYSVIAVG